MTNSVIIQVQARHMFKDRKDAGIKLAQILAEAKIPHEDVLVLGLPRGGVVVAAEVAKKLSLPMDIISVRKIAAPFNSEFAIGAVDDKKNIFLNKKALDFHEVSSSYIDEVVERECKEAIRRSKVYRSGMQPLSIKGRTVILVDDGIATGATVRAAIKTCKNEASRKIILAVPVAARDTLEELRHEVDEVYCQHTPDYFGAVAVFYEKFDQTTDDEVIQLMQALEENRTAD